VQNFQEVQGIIKEEKQNKSEMTLEEMNAYSIETLALV
jgi:hypothetical protein